MKGSWLRYFGWLGFLGLLGFVTSNAGFAGFFGFFGFFGFTKYGDDERLQINIGLASRNAFVVLMVVYPVTTVCGAFIPGSTLTVYTIGFVALVVLQLLVFSLSLAYYER